MFLTSLALFIAGYLFNIFYISVLYHRGLTHGAVVLGPRLTRWVAWTGNWVTGIDPKAWVCMHRMHHLHSDSKFDPHSPHFQGVFGVMKGQLKSYRRILARLIVRDRELEALTSDIPFGVSYLNRKGLWALPYALHFALGLVIAVALGSLCGIAYYSASRAIRSKADGQLAGSPLWV